MRLRIASSLSNSWAKEPVEAVDSGRRCRKTLRELVSVNSRTGLCPTEMEIEKWRPETGAQNPPRTDRNDKNCRIETGACQPNPREYRGFSHTGKLHHGDPTAWLTRQSLANRSPPVTPCFPLLFSEKQPIFPSCGTTSGQHFFKFCRLFRWLWSFPSIRGQRLFLRKTGIFF